MYELSEQQVDYILDDIKSRGVEMEELQSDLLDHICCIIEQDLEPGGNFETFYAQTIPRFFKRELKEIEEETILLLTFKHYYAMRKVMFTTGAISVVGFIIGSFFKVMHWPGANVMLLLGIGLASLVFLPLLFILKTREANSRRDKMVLGVGTFFGILISLATLFKILHWPGANNMWIASLGILVLVFLPLYFFTGIRNPETKINTITSSMLILFFWGLLFTLTALRPSKLLVMNNMYGYVQREELLKRMQAEVSDSAAASPLYAEINRDCQKIKEIILQNETGKTSLPGILEEGDIFIQEGAMDNSFYGNAEAIKLYAELQKAVNEYNAKVRAEQEKIPVDYTVLGTELEGIGKFSNLNVLNGMTQIQMFLAEAHK